MKLKTSVFFIFLLSFTFVSANFGYIDNTKPKLDYNIKPVINYSMIPNINNSDYLDGYHASAFCKADGTNCVILNPFNQVLNTTSNVSFDKVHIKPDASWMFNTGIYPILQWGNDDEYYYDNGHAALNWYDFDNGFKLVLETDKNTLLDFQAGAIYASIFFGDGSGITNLKETDPKWTGNFTLVPYLAGNNVFTGSNNFTSAIRLINGTNTIPAYSFRDDPDTGFYSNGTPNRVYMAGAGTKYWSFGGSWANEPELRAETGNNMQLTFGNGNNFLRGVSVWSQTWNDSVPTYYTQTGNQSNNAAWSAYLGTAYNRFAFMATKFQITNAVLNIAVPTDYFEILPGGVKKFSIDNSGNMKILHNASVYTILNTSSDGAFSIDVKNGTRINLMDNTNITGNLFISGNLSIREPYGMFSSTENQTLIATDTAYPITFNWTEDSYLINKASDNTNFSFLQPGNYLIKLSAILTTISANDHVEIWVQKNEVNVPRSNIKVQIPNANTETQLAAEFILEMNTTDKMRIMWASEDSTNVKLSYSTNTSYSPEKPSIIMTITKISDIT